MREKEIIDAYCLIRKIDHTIPDDVLDFMKDSAIEKLNNAEMVNRQGTGNYELNEEWIWETITAKLKPVVSWPERVLTIEGVDDAAKAIHERIVQGNKELNQFNKNLIELAKPNIAEILDGANIIKKLRAEITDIKRRIKNPTK